MEETIIKLFVDLGFSVKEISKEVNLSFREVTNILLKNGFPTFRKEREETLKYKAAFDYFKENNEPPLLDVCIIFGIDRTRFADFVRKTGYKRKINYRKVSKNAKKHKIEIGQVYGMYKVLEEVCIEYTKGKKEYTKIEYKCQQVNTGKIIYTSGSYLTGRQNIIENNTEELQLGLKKYLYRSYKDGAVNRKHKFELTFEEFKNIISQNCHYCGSEPQEATSKMLIKRGNTRMPTIKYNGIDRIDPTKDYTIDNCVPCCRKCNYMKHVLQEKEFFEHIKKIYDHSIKPYLIEE